MATLEQLLAQYAAYNTQRGTKTGIRLPGGVQGPDGWVPCSQSPLGCNEIVGMTAIPGTTYWMPLSGSSGTTVIIPPTDFGPYRDKAKADILAEVQRELELLLASLGKTSAAYASAHAQLEAELQATVNQQFAVIDSVTNVNTFPVAEQSALQAIDNAAIAAYQRWLASTAPAAAQSVAQAGVVQTVAQSVPIDGGTVGAAANAMTASSTTLALNDIPGLDSAVQWYQSVRAAFLRAPDELRDDLARLDYVRQHAQPQNHPALGGLPAVETTLRSLLADWTSMAVTGTQIDDALSHNDASLATLSRIVSLAAQLVVFFGRKSGAEATLDVIAEQVLTPDEYARWKVIHANPLGGNGVTPWLIGAGVLALVLLARRRR